MACCKEAKIVKDSVIILKGSVQTYAWGKLGQSSAVADLASNAETGLTIDPNTPYAELWMGTHAKGPCLLASSGESLSSLISEKPSYVGDAVLAAFPKPGQLPFLFKVLSVNKALSIQAHPNKTLAEQLHSLRPEHYPDANHKPEMAIALTKFEGLCGFRPKEEIVNFMKKVPELSEIVGYTLVSSLEDADGDVAVSKALKACFTALMTVDVELVANNLATLVERLQKAVDGGENTESELGDLILRVHRDFAGDVGCFVFYFLNYMVLEPGQAMFLQANLPHAYLAGDCMECMACSDNVVRAGLTPKYKDVQTLCDMLTYECRPAAANMFPSEACPNDPALSFYNPPVPDFAVDRMHVETTGSYKIRALESGSIILVVKGSGQCGAVSLKRGSILFVPANQAADIITTSKTIIMFRAYCSL